MAWINPPEPPDSEVLYTDSEGRDFTWGDHRQMEGWLKELEESDPVVKASRERLDEALEKAGYDTGARVIRICEHCGVEEYTLHKLNCPDSVNDLGREAGGYQYLDDTFQPVWLTSVPRTDDFALRHFKNIQLMHPEVNVTYILRRAMHETEYKMMPYRFDRTLGEEGEVLPIVQPGS